MLLVGASAAGAGLVRNPFFTQQGWVTDQPVPFSHKHHVQDDGIDCRYCHTGAETRADAGLPPRAILTAATVNAARVLGREREAGSLAVGKRADLVVLDANPLADIRNLHRIHGVMTQGRWLELGEIERMIAAAYGLSEAEAAVD